MALWRVLDKTSGWLRSPSSTRHKPTQRTKPRNRRKSKAAAKIRRHAQAFRVRRIFLRRRDLSLFNGAFLSAVLFAPLFLCRLRSVTIGSPKASVIVSKASLLARANVSLVCQGSPRIAWCNVVAKSLTQKKITAYAVIFLVRPQGLEPWTH